MNNMSKQAYGVWKPPPHMPQLQVLKNYFPIVYLFSVYQVFFL
jgi:hypothetical protein